MDIYALNRIPEAVFTRIMKRSAGASGDIVPGVRTVLDVVRREGDAYLTASARTRFGPSWNGNLTVTPDEISAATAASLPDTVAAFRQMIANITAVQRAQLPAVREPVVSPVPGIGVWREWRPIGTVGLYIPGGRGAYPSSVFMSAIPAIIAGCKNIVLCTPASRTGKVPDSTLLAAGMLGITNIFRLGGAEAIAAMAYGTDTVPRVSKIFGAGNAYVTAAKMLVRDDVAIDMPAGPSEVFIIADDTANPDFIAADLLADGEHGPDSACVLVTTSPDTARRTAMAIEEQLEGKPTAGRARESLSRYGLIAVAPFLEDAVAFANRYAPEHLEIMTRDPRSVVSGITDAGSVFLGPWTTKAAGDYATGANHVLPTGGMAKMYPPLGVDAFGKWMQVQECSENGLAAIRKSIETVAGVEDLPFHANSVSIRFLKGKPI